MWIKPFLNKTHSICKNELTELIHMERQNRLYQLLPTKIGCEVFGIDLKQNVTEDLVQQIRKDVKKHRLLIFRGQGLVPPSRHLEISRWFGEIESTYVIRCLLLRLRQISLYILIFYTLVRVTYLIIYKCGVTFATGFITIHGPLTGIFFEFPMIGNMGKYYECYDRISFKIFVISQ